MARRLGRMAFVGVVALAACSRTNPAYLGSARDAAPPPPPQDGGRPADGSPPPADGGDDCVPGAACQPDGAPCQVGTLVCAASGPTCDHLHPAPNGVPCGSGYVCKDGSCNACPAGDLCPDPGGDECLVGTVSCAAGVPECLSPTPVADGTPCTGGLCRAGSCGAGLCSDAVPCGAGQVCNLSGCAATVTGACVEQPLTCPFAYSPVCGCDGTTYDNDCARLRAGAALAHDGACAGAVVEDCLNGIDDDGDGLTDCDDPACQAAYTCAPQPPAGWVGIGWVDPTVVRACPLGLTDLPLFDPAAIVPGTFDCGCQCTPAPSCAVPYECSDAPLSCSNPTSRAPIGTTCQSIPPPPLPGGCRARPPLAQGSCTPVATTVASDPAYTWAPTGTACLTGDGGYCTANSGGAPAQCVPRPPAGAAGPCIAASGPTPAACPAPYTLLQIFGDGTATDQRTCTACTCGALANATCGCANGQQCGIDVFAGDGCGDASTMFLPVVMNTCISTTLDNIASASAHAIGLQVTAHGGCQPSESTVTGEIVPHTWITVCCLSP
jgi:hypothetical protein